MTTHYDIATAAEARNCTEYEIHGECPICESNAVAVLDALGIDPEVPIAEQIVQDPGDETAWGRGIHFERARIAADIAKIPMISREAVLAVVRGDDD